MSPYDEAVVKYLIQFHTAEEIRETLNKGKMESPTFIASKKEAIKRLENGEV